ncbi:MAG: hypothetical protein OEM21_06590 [Nitrosopumilus sp.]|nr:hypothetical protein [Nitrosopumilus sp.]
MLESFLNPMKKWFFWAGVSFIIGGTISLALNLGVQESLGRLEDLTGYAIGWIAVGIVLIIFGLIKGKKERS